MGELKVTVEAGRVVLAGQITENADFRPALGVGSAPVDLELTHVSRINSSGVREWIHFMRALKAQGATVTLLGCSRVMVDQLNMITNFAEGAKVKSIHVPTVCNRCQATRDVLLEVDGVAKPPEAFGTCQCGGALELDEDPVRYFAFLEGL